MIKVKKALITSAGYGSRFLPATKAVQKEMLPIVDRPLIDYLVSDCVRAGIEEIIFVVKAGETQVKEYFSDSPKLWRYLEKMNKTALIPGLKQIHQQAKFTFITQAESDQYGTAVPLRLAEAELESEPAFLVLMGDDFVFHKDGQSHVTQMLETFSASQAAGLISVVERPVAELSRYGVVAMKSQNGFNFLEKLVEKPQPGSEPSHCVNISKYVLTPAVFPILKQQVLNPKSGELYITDTVSALALSAQVVVHQTTGEYLDGGSPQTWLYANKVVAASRSELAHIFK